MFYFEDITEDLLFIACAIPPFLPCYCCSHCPYPRFASPPCNAIPLCNVPPPPIQHPPSRCSDVSFVPYYPALPPAEGCTFFFSVQLLREGGGEEGHPHFRKGRIVANPQLHECRQFYICPDLCNSSDHPLLLGHSSGICT